jgi:hypothetical protein
MSSSFANEVNVFDFTETEISELKVRRVRGADNKTIYTVGSNENGNFLKAVADNAASGLGKEVIIDLNKTPFINITWKIEKDLKGIDERTRKGHDFAARVFVVKKTGLTPLSNKAVNYVFSSNNSVNQSWRSPYTKSSVDYVLSTTKDIFFVFHSTSDHNNFIKDNINEWVTVKANVKGHFKKLHDLDVEELSGVAIMTDTDQTKIKAISYYQNIYFSSE